MHWDADVDYTLDHVIWNIRGSNQVGILSTDLAAGGIFADGSYDDFSLQVFSATNIVNFQMAFLGVPVQGKTRLFFNCTGSGGTCVLVLSQLT